MIANRPAEVFSPGEFIREELEARGWTQGDLAEIMGRPIQVVNGIVIGKKIITPRTANELAAALGTSAEMWTNLQTAYSQGVRGK
jgi:HTH-type transcriptional regulator/antitoxin HigA